MHKITNLGKVGINWSLKLQGNNERKTPLFHKFVCFKMPKKSFRPEVPFSIWERNFLFQWKKKNYFRSRCISTILPQSTALVCSLPRKLSAKQFLSNYQQCPLSLMKTASYFQNVITPRWIILRSQQSFFKIGGNYKSINSKLASTTT